MCGIAGYLGKFNKAFLENANNVQRHRGPDDCGLWFDENSGVGLAHRRLSIIDVSNNGHQPMTDRDNSSTIIFNGEIYNYRELKENLQQKGHHFKSSSDTEVLLYLYKEYKEKMLEKLNGIFAFAIWDKVERELLICRDGMGVKPLYYVDGDRGFLFASEIKALLFDNYIERQIDSKALHGYLSFLWTPAPRTMLKGVKKLEPGHALIVKENRIKRKWRFYDLPYGRNLLQGDEEEISRELAENISKAVERQLVSDVPVGAFLSGGLDSSAIVAFAIKKYNKGDLNCFTIGLNKSDAASDGFVEDFPYAQKVAD
ncbi:MAG: asparagine synthase (glutamine-hydrolyzing), partial [Nitrospinae bacterium]|nr:asparagine synthase (glutamine-hydrolyzing) [Nitrospinota bacterium]